MSKKVYVRSEESRAKMHEAAKHRPPISDETRAKMSAAHRGKKLSKEHIEALRKSNIGRPMSQKCRETFIAAGHSKEAIDKRRQVVLGTKRTAEVCEKIRQANLGMHYYTNGVVNVKTRGCPQGFRPGVTRKKSCTVNRAVQDYILSKYQLSSEPQRGSSYILPTGQFLVLPEDHEGLFNDIQDSLGICEDVAEVQLEQAGWIRCNGSLPYIKLLYKELTVEQVKAVEAFNEMISRKQEQ